MLQLPINFQRASNHVRPTELLLKAIPSVCPSVCHIRDPRQAV